MKTILSLLVVMAFGLTVSASCQKDDKVPAAAKAGFATQFPKAEKVKWSVEKAGEYEAEFKRNGVETSVLVDANGKLLETETEIEKAELPEVVKATLAKDFAGYKLDEIEKVTDAKGTVSYEMEASKGKEELEISFDQNGKLLSKEEMKEEKD